MTKAIPPIIAIVTAVLKMIFENLISNAPQFDMSSVPVLLSRNQI